MQPERYLEWQKKLGSKTFFRSLWVFLGVYSVVLVFLAGLYLLLKGEYQVVGIALLSFTVARLVFSPVIYLFFKKQRPYQKLKFEAPYSLLFSFKQGRHNAFPSDHALSFASISFAIFAFEPALGACLFVLTFLNGLARIILGYHDEWDILGGWLVGVLSALLSLYFLVPVLFTRP